MIETKDLDSYLDGYDEYLEKTDVKLEQEDLDALYDAYIDYILEEEFREQITDDL